MAYNNMTLTLLIQPDENRVVYAEASKEAVDCLFNILQLPLGSVASLVSPEAMPGSIGRLYASVKDIGEGYWLPNQDKASLLRPPLFYPATAFPLAAKDLVGSWMPVLYTCPHLCKQFKVTEVRGYECPGCEALQPAQADMSTEVRFVSGQVSTDAVDSALGGDAAIGPGFVRAGHVYLISDNLRVEPASDLTELVRQQGLDLDSLRVREVELTIEAGIKILKASLRTHMVLTTAFSSEIVIH